jgi:hypothetical protein
MTGMLDSHIDDLALFVKSYENNSFYIRIGYEFDSSENNYDPFDYIGAFRRIVSRFDVLQVNNSAFVWHSWGFRPRDGHVIDGTVYFLICITYMHNAIIQ